MGEDDISDLRYKIRLEYVCLVCEHYRICVELRRFCNAYGLAARWATSRGRAYLEKDGTSIDYINLNEDTAFASKCVRTVTKISKETQKDIIEELTEARKKGDRITDFCEGCRNKRRCGGKCRATRIVKQIPCGIKRATA